MSSPASRSPTRSACSSPSGSRSGGSAWPSTSANGLPSSNACDSPWRTSRIRVAPGGAANLNWRYSATNQRQDLVPALLHVLNGDERLQAQPQQRLGVRRAHVEVPVVVVDRDAVEMRDPGVAVALLDLGHLRRRVLHLGVDLAGDEVLRAVVTDELAHPASLDGQLLE